MPDLVPFLIDIAPFIAIGMAAQMIDGALGMAFGVITQTLLVSALGVPPATASASVHLVELFTTGASGASHIWHRNVDWGLFWRLVPFGVVGGVSGAYLLSSIDASAARPFSSNLKSRIWDPGARRALLNKGCTRIAFRRPSPEGAWTKERLYP